MVVSWYRSAFVCRLDNRTRDRAILMRPSLFLSAFLASSLASFNLVPAAERPSAPRLFPDGTMAYLRVDNATEMKTKMGDTMMGRIAADPEVKPILQEIYGSMMDSASVLEQVLGIRLEELLSIPNGEFSLALVPTDTVPAVCLLLEAGSEMSSVEVLLTKLTESLEAQGFKKETKEFAGITMIAWGDPDNRERQFGYFIDSGCLVASSSVAETEKLSKTWTGNGVDFKPLVDNRRFTAIMSRCVGAEGERPQASFFVDPIAIVRNVSRLSQGGTMVTAMLPVLGVDGIQGFGGSMILQPKDFESVMHMHLLLNSPRKNLMATIRPKTGKTDPEDWVDEGVASYFTANWEFRKTLAAIKKIVDSFQGDGSFQTNVIDNMSREMGIDFEKEFLEQIDDRYSLAQFITRPISLNSSSQVHALHLKDPKEFKSTTLPKIFNKIKDRDDKWSTHTVAGEVIYVRKSDFSTENIQGPDFSVAVLGDCLVIAERRRALEEAIYTMNGQNEVLSDSVEFKLVRDRIKKQLGDRESSIIAYQRPEESFRLFYDLAADPANREKLDQFSENNPVITALSNALKKHKLPKFDVISKYLAPAGMFIFEDDSGIHLTNFALRRDN